MTTGVLSNARASGALPAALAAMHDGGVSWIEQTYERLCRSLAAGEISNGERLGGMIGDVLGALPRMGDVAAVQRQLHLSALAGLTHGIKMIISQEQETSKGVAQIRPVVATLATPSPLRWIGWIWLSRAFPDSIGAPRMARLIKTGLERRSKSDDGEHSLSGASQEDPEDTPCRAREVRSSPSRRRRDQAGQRCGVLAEPGP